MEPRFGALSSSVDPTKLSATVSGIILGLGTLIIFGLGRFGIEIGNAEIQQLAELGGAVASSLWTAYGVVRKLVLFVYGLIRK